MIIRVQKKKDCKEKARVGPWKDYNSDLAIIFKLLNLKNHVKFKEKCFSTEKRKKKFILINHPICPFNKCNDHPELDKDDPDFCNCCSTYIH